MEEYWGPDRGRAIIREVLQDHRLHPEDFFGKRRHAHLVAARRDAAIRLNEAGYSSTKIGRMLCKNHATVLNYLPAGRSKKHRYHASEVVLRHLCGGNRDLVEEFARAEGISPAILIAQWIGERAEHEAAAKARAL